MEKIRPIQKLSSRVIGQIAAGEVVERPAAAVKELVENSIDAGATAITVELREGGIPYLRVSDNGCGIPASQIRMAFERHATSKLASEEELFDVRTLGFRGEALASIAAVSKVTLTTRTAEGDFGVKAVAEAGELLDVREAAAPVGTTVLVRDLFFNTPVRLKFLKKPAYEASLVSDYMMRLILSRPDISFRFASQGKTVYQSAGDGSVESALYCVLGKEAARGMKRVKGTEGGLLLEGYVGVGELARGNRQHQSFFVNGRYFRDAGLSKALEDACQGLVMIGRFPSCVLYLRLPCQQVDVNVHPNKLEVRFQRSQEVARAVETLVREAVCAETLEDRLTGRGASLPEEEQSAFRLVSLPSEEKVPEAPEDSGAGETASQDSLQEALSGLAPVLLPAKAAPLTLRETYAFAGVERAMPHMPNPAPMPPPVASAAQPPDAPLPAPPPEEPPIQETLLGEEATPRPRLIGIAFQTYWLFEAGDRLLWVDQHAAHERILYDKLWKRLEGERVSQRLLAPVLVRVTARERAMAEELMPLMEEAGFCVEPFDETSVALHAIPTIFGHNAPAAELFREALDSWLSERGQATRERMRRQVTQMACKRAIKAGDALSDAEVAHLLEEMMQTGILPTCPHGRPILAEVTRRDMEKRFKRIQ